MDMSTRATYLIANRTGQRVYLYGHYDGYPMGAAERLKQVLTYQYTHPRSYGIAETLLRVDENMQITNDHEGHGDTEYRYNIDRDINGKIFVEAIERKWMDNEIEPNYFWKRIFNGTMEEFIKKFEHKEGASQ
jgi:hypothetical protein